MVLGGHGAAGLGAVAGGLPALGRPNGPMRSTEVADRALSGEPRCRCRAACGAALGPRMEECAEGRGLRGLQVRRGLIERALVTPSGVQRRRGQAAAARVRCSGPVPVRRALRPAGPRR